jgi:hypothetical protein
MAPKKGKGGKPGQEEDNSTIELYNLYKKYSKEQEFPMNKLLEEKLREQNDNGEHLPEILINEKITEFGARAIANALRNVE